MLTSTVQRNPLLGSPTSLKRWKPIMTCIAMCSEQKCGNRPALGASINRRLYPWYHGVVWLGSETRSTYMDLRQWFPPPPAPLSFGRRHACLEFFRIEESVKMILREQTSFKEKAHYSLLWLPPFGRFPRKWTPFCLFFFPSVLANVQHYSS